MREHQEEEVLKITIKKKRDESDERTVSAEKDRDSVVEKKSKNISQHYEHDENKNKVESKEFPTGRQKSFSFSFSLKEPTVGVVDFGINIVHYFI